MMITQIDYLEEELKKRIGMHRHRIKVRDIANAFICVKYHLRQSFYHEKLYKQSHVKRETNHNMKTLEGYSIRSRITL